MDLDFLNKNNSGLLMNAIVCVVVILGVYYASGMVAPLKPLNDAINSVLSVIPGDFDNNIKVVVISIVVAVIVAFLMNTGNMGDKVKSVLEEGFEAEVKPPQEEEDIEDVVDIQKEDTVKNANTPVESNEVYSSIEGQINTDNKFPKDCFPKDQLQPQELLPGDYESSWKEVAPNNPGALEDQNLLEAGYHVGVNTVGQTLRNANLQLRSEPANPQVKVSPWLQSTIDPDSNRKPLEIGGQ